MLLGFTIASLLLAHPQDPRVDFVHLHADADAALVAGEWDEARELFERCLELDPENPTIAYGLACTEARAHAPQLAVRWFGRAVVWGFRDAALVRWDEDLTSVRGVPRFVETLARLERSLYGLYPSPEAWAIVAKGGPAASVAVIDDAGTRVASGSMGGAVLLLDAATGAQLARWRPFEAQVWGLDIAPDGTLAALSVEGELALLDPRSGQVTLFAEGLPPRAKTRDWVWPFGPFLEFDAGGERLLAGNTDRGAGLWTREGKLVRRLEGELGNMFGLNVAWSPDGSVIATMDGSRVRFLDGRTGEFTGSELDCGSRVRGIAFHPDGGRIATGHDDSRVFVWDLETREKILSDQYVDPVIPTDGYVPVLGFSPGGERLAYSTAGGIHVVVIESDTGDRVWESEFLGGRMGEPVDVRWSSGGERLWFAYRGGVQAWTTDLKQSGGGLWLGRGQPPSVGAGSRGAFAAVGATVLVDLATAHTVWRRLEREDGYLIQGPSGHFAGTLRDLAGLELISEPRGPRKRLVDHVRTAFDPKRVRAALARVPLFHPR